MVNKRLVLILCVIALTAVLITMVVVGGSSSVQDVTGLLTPAVNTSNVAVNISGTISKETPSPTQGSTPTPVPDITDTPLSAPPEIVTLAPTLMPTATALPSDTMKPTSTHSPRPETTPMPEATYRPLKVGERVYDYVKNSDLFDTPDSSVLGYVGTYFPKGTLSSITDDCILEEATWFVERDTNRSDSWPGYDSTIYLVDFSMETRQEVEEFLRVVYPVGYEEVMSLIVSTLRQELWEYRWGYDGEMPMAGTMGVRYIDAREVFLVLRSDFKALLIHIKDLEAVNPVVSEPWPQDMLDTLIKEGMGQADSSFAKWFREEYSL